MAIDMKTNELIDPFNGKEDIKNRSINFVGNPSDRIREDYLRILRAIRFRTIIGGEYEEKTKESIHSSCHLIRNISKERIRTEILKTLVVQKASRFFRDLHEFDILEYIFPSLEKCFDHYNGVYHHTDVFNHSMICGDALSTKNKLLKLAGYLHDVGKPPSYVMNNEENFANHEMMSYELVREELSNLKFSNDEIDFISNVIKHHMRNIMVSPLFTISKKSFKKTLFNLEKDNVNFKDLVRLKIGDRRGNHKKFPYLKQEIRETLSLYDEMIKNPSVSPTGLKSLNINGEDIISLGFKEGPIIGRILNDCLNAILEEKLTNEKGELKEYIKTQFG
jgi:tRNA nucleotidyltransferase/poly(A) polymerase